ncbi:MAG TPA: hypothetical protein PKC43_10600 [Phycisphaerales bacterium]|nr:hypothetical protein [Phycisphaerales bacterium]HMP37884.1 hypothetical protein [Phycisphaerales bacterium]
MTPARGKADALRTGGVALLCAAALLRGLVPNIPQATFDVDPTLAAGAQPGLVPAASLLLDALMLAASAALLLGEQRSGRRVLLWPCLLALLPLPALAWHGAERAEHLWRGATWFAAILGGVALAHAARDPRLRRIACALLLAGVAPLVVRGAAQVLIEHPAALREYAAIREAFLADRGWAPDSAAARIYEDRLRQPEASGWFGFANIASSFFAAASVTLAGILIASWRAGRRTAALLPATGGSGAPGRGSAPRRAGLAASDGARPAEPSGGHAWQRVPPSSGAIGVIGLLFIGAAALLMVNGSKGAIAAALIGALTLTATAMAQRFVARAPERPEPALGRGITRMAPLIAPALVGCAIGAVLLRGAVLPESFAAERSLLFRWHYLSDAARVLLRHPLVGVGPDGFQEAMIAVRPMHHPEEVSSAHGVLVDWLVALGPLGLAWAALFIGLLGRAGSAALASEPAPPEPPRDASGAAIERDAPPPGFSAAALGGMAAVLLAATAIEATALDPALLLTRLVGVAFGVAAFAALATTLRGAAGGFVRAALFAGACTIAVHAQVEMTLFMQGSLPWALLLIAVAAPLSALPGRRESALLARTGLGRAPVAPPAFAAAIALLAAAGLTFRAVPLLKQERAMAAAAVPLAALGAARAEHRGLAAARDDAERADRGASLLAALARIGTPEESQRMIAALLEGRERDRREAAMRTVEEVLVADEVRLRSEAIEALDRAWAADPSSLRPFLAAIDQALRVAPLAPEELREITLFRARHGLNYVLAEREDSLRVRRRNAEVLEMIARDSALRGDPRERPWATALAAWEEVARRDPASIPARLRVVECAVALGRTDLALSAIDSALAIDEALRLDPRKKLAPERREALLRRRQELGTRPEPSATPR